MIDYQLTPREQELLGILQEECAEVIQVISKIRRFGLLSSSPFDPEHTTNLQLLKMELGDVQAITQLLSVDGLEGSESVLTAGELQVLADKKKIKLQKYLRT